MKAKFNSEFSLLCSDDIDSILLSPDGRGGVRGKRMFRLITLFSILISLIFSSVPQSFSAEEIVEKILTKVVIRVVAKDSKVIGSSVGGAFVRIKNLET